MQKVLRRFRLFSVRFCNWLPEIPKQCSFTLDSKKNLRETSQCLVQLHCHCKRSIRNITKLRVKFSDLNEHKFRHNFECLRPICNCGTAYEDNEHYLLHCPHFNKLALSKKCLVLMSPTWIHKPCATSFFIGVLT